VAAHTGMSQPPLAHYLSHFVAVWPPDKRAIGRGGGWCPTMASPAAVE
jgi:hypothetical protein